MREIHDFFSLFARMTLEEAYRELGVKPGTPLDEIKKRYRQLSLERHPDRNPGQSDEGMKRLNDAWDTIQQSGGAPSSSTKKQQQRRYNPGDYRNPPVFGDDNYTVDPSPDVLRFYRSVMMQNRSRLNVPFMEMRGTRKDDYIQVVFNRDNTPEDILIVLEEHMKEGSKSYSRTLDSCQIEAWPAWLITQGLNGTAADWKHAFGPIPERPPTDEEEDESRKRTRSETMESLAHPEIRRLINELGLSVTTNGFGDVEIQWINPNTSRRMDTHHDASVLMQVYSDRYHVSMFEVDKGGASARSTGSQYIGDAAEAARVFREYVEKVKSRTSGEEPLYGENSIYAALQDPQMRQLIQEYNLEWYIRGAYKQGTAQGIVTWVNYKADMWNGHALYIGSVSLIINQADALAFEISERAETAEGNLGWNKLYATEDLNDAVQQFRRIIEERSSNQLGGTAADLRTVRDFFEDL